MYMNPVRWWLTGLLVFMPFQRMIVKSIEVWSRQMSFFVNRLEEITVVILLPLAIREFYKNREIFNRSHIILLSPVLAITICGFISAIVNGTSLFISILGIFDYIKYFLFIFIYAAFFREFNNFKKIFHLLLIVAVVLVIVAFMQELWALSSRYISGRCIYDKGNYLFGNTTLNLYRDSFREHWRLGIFRSPSFLRSPNMFGFYCLFILTIYCYFKKKVNFAVLITLLTGVFISVARMVYVGLVFLAGVQILRGRRLFMALFILPFVILLFYMSTLWDFNILKFTNISKLSKIENVGVTPYRKYAKDKAIEVWKENPFLGVGPGMFGGAVSVIFNSPLYEEYSFKIGEKRLLKKWKSLDQFWPQVLAEMGIFGSAAFAGLFITWFITFFMLGRRSSPNEVKGLFMGLSIFTIIIVMWSLGGNIKNAVIFTYSAFAGMGLGCINKHKE